MRKMIRKERKKEEKRAETRRKNLMMRKCRPPSPNMNKKARRKLKIQMRKYMSSKRRAKTRSNNLISKSLKSKK